MIERWDSVWVVLDPKEIKEQTKGGVYIVAGVYSSMERLDDAFARMGYNKKITL